MPQRAGHGVGVLDAMVQAVLCRLRQRLAALYGERLRGVYLFGSCARGEQDEESDLDVLIVLDRYDRYAAEVDRTGPVVSQLSLECGRSISRVFVSEADWASAPTPFLRNVREESVAA